VQQQAVCWRQYKAPCEDSSDPLIELGNCLGLIKLMYTCGNLLNATLPDAKAAGKSCEGYVSYHAVTAGVVLVVLVFVFRTAFRDKTLLDLKCMLIYCAAHHAWQLAPFSSCLHTYIYIYAYTYLCIFMSCRLQCTESIKYQAYQDSHGICY